MDMPGSWINDISGRFDAEYYYPEYLRFHQTIKRLPHKVFGSLIANRTRVLYRTTETFAPGLLERGAKFLSPSDVINGSIDWDQVPEVNNEMLTLYPQGIGQPGDFLIEVKGDAKKAIVLDDRTPENALISGSFQKVWLKKQEDSNYILAVFLSKTWLSQRKRLRSNINIKFIDKDSLLSILIPWPTRSLRKAISNKIQTAKILRLAASEKKREAISEIIKYLPDDGLITSHQINHIGSDTFSIFLGKSEINSIIAAQFFSSLRRKALSVLRSCKCPTEDLINSAKRSRKKGLLAVKWYINPSKVSGTDGYWQKSGVTDVASVVQAEPGNVLYLRMRPYLNKITIVDIDAPVLTSSEYYVYELENLEDAFYAALCLRQPWALAQVIDLAKGDRPRVDAEFVDKIKIPWPPEGGRRAIGALYRQFFSDRRRAEKLIENAITDVERLIEGTLDEGQCLTQGRELAEEFGLERP